MLVFYRNYKGASILLKLNAVARKQIHLLSFNPSSDLHSILIGIYCYDINSLFLSVMAEYPMPIV